VSALVQFFAYRDARLVGLLAQALGEPNSLLRRQTRFFH